MMCLRVCFGLIAQVMTGNCSFAKELSFSLFVLGEDAKQGPMFCAAINLVQEPWPAFGFIGDLITHKLIAQ